MEDHFSRIVDGVAEFTREFAWADGRDTLRLNRESLLERIANHKRCGMDTIQEEKALAALDAANGESNAK